MKRAKTGRYVPISTIGGEAVRAFVPAPLPPRPALAIGGGLRRRLDEALLALGRLDSVTSLLPSPEIFLYMYVRREAVLSSQIEGTQSSLSDLLLFEAEEQPGVPIDDVTEVSNYVRALEHGVERIRGGFPLSNRLLREVHALLLSRGRGEGKQPGEFRRSQNWIGGSRPGNAVHVPPPPGEVEACMAALERFLHDDPEPTAPLLKAALAHVQFETIHPFLDGNGRVGRLMIALVLLADGVLREPILYLSHFFKLHRATYYDLLDRVRRDGDWEAWLDFFAQGVTETASGAVATTQRLAERLRQDRARLDGLGRGRGSAADLLHVLQRRPIASIQTLATATGLAFVTVARAIERLANLEIVREVTGQRRNRLYSYWRYLELLGDPTEPAPAPGRT